MTRKIPAALALAATLATAAHADISLGDRATLSGFGTAGVVRTDTDQAEFGRDRQPGGATRDPDALVDSNLGVQLTVKATDWLSGTVQVLAQRRDGEAMDVEPEWVFIRIQPTGDLTLRLGRMTLPAFLVSDFRNVGYANTWLRAPNEVYALSLFRRFEGADLTWRRSIGESSLTAQVLYGDSDVTVLGTRPDVENVRGASLTWEYAGLTLRASRTLSDVVAVGLEGYPMADEYTFNAFGATYDRGTLVVQAEFVQRRAKAFRPIVAADGRYVMAGYRFGAVTPYVIYARTEPKTYLTPVLISADQETRAVGVRWDAFSSAALKLQLEQVDTRRTQGISFNGPVSGTVNAASLALDFTF
jgi:hypothetical protein